jgi:hypothetical protein
VLPPLGRCECHLLRGRYPSVIAPTGSCATPVGLSPASAFSLVKSPGRLHAVPAAPGSFPTLSPGIFLSLDAGSRTPAVQLSPVSSTMSSAFPKRRMGRLPAFYPRITTSRSSVISRLQIFLDVPASKLLSPRSFLPLHILLQAAGDFTSGPIVLCCLHTHRHNHSLCELSPRQVTKLRQCSVLRSTSCRATLRSLTGAASYNVVEHRRIS